MIIGLGVDIVEISRIKRALRRAGKRFLERIFTGQEIAYARARPKTMEQHLAARFAAKEAFLKAIGTGWDTRPGPGWREIEVVVEHKAKNTSRPTTHAPRSTPYDLHPTLHLSGRARTLCQRLKVGRIHLSLSHTRQYALAVVLLAQR